MRYYINVLIHPTNSIKENCCLKSTFSFNSIREMSFFQNELDEHFMYNLKTDNLFNSYIASLIVLGIKKTQYVYHFDCVSEALEFVDLYLFSSNKLETEDNSKFYKLLSEITFF